MKRTIFSGSGVALVTPFADTGVDFDKLGELIEFHIANKTDAIIICGTTGEASTMSDSERKEAIKYTVDKVARRVAVIAGTGSNNTRHSLELSEYAQSVGVDGLLLVTPYYNKTTQKGLIEHFSYIAQRIDVPIILYEVPSRTGVNVAVDTYAVLAKLPNIVAVKDATGNIAHTAQIVSTCGHELAVYSGNDDCIVAVLSLGGKGVISVLANVAPAQVHDMCELYFRGNTTESLKIQLKYMELIGALFAETNPIPVKTALNLLGFEVGSLRLPLCDMSEDNFNKLKNALQILKPSEL